MSLFGESAPCPFCGKKVRRHRDPSSFLCPHCGHPGPFATEEQAARWTRAQQASGRYGEALAELKQGNIPTLTKAELADAAATAGYKADDVRRWDEEAIRGYVGRVLADDFMSETEEAQVRRAADLVGVDATSLIKQDPDLSQRLVIGQINAGRLEPVASPTMMCKRGEVEYLEWPAQLLKTVVKREFQAGYSGFSFPIGKTGIRYRVGGARGKSVVVGNEVVVDDSGTLCISSRRAVFIGGRKTMEMPYSKLVSLSVFSDGVQFHQSNRVNAPVFHLAVQGSHAGEVVAALVHAAVARLD